MSNPLTSPRRHASQLASLAGVVARASRAHRASPIAVLRLARVARAGHGFEYEEALATGLLDPAGGAPALHAHASKHATLEAQRRINPETLAFLTEEKAFFHPYLEAAGVPAPRLLGVIGAGTGWGHDGRVVAGPGAFAAWIPDLPAEFVVKPSAGYHGMGVMVVVRDGAGLRVLGRGAADARALHREMTSDPRFPLWVVQERIRNASSIEALGSAEAVQTARICTLVRRDGSVDVLHANLRLAAPGALIDNYRGGTTGNSFTTIDDEGRLGPAWSRRPDGAGFISSPTLPGSGRRIEGARLPDWDEALAVVRRAAPHFLPVRTIGWDVAFTDDGPMVIEANMWWDPPPIPGVGDAVRALLDSAA
ncbi:MAG TPA: sugar-transfer associated ATP-grasp domain-containing protein [Miltoncostaea sp.]|nr:sugar-transfer associated ATP-grasp domain-containing protein [Miltoncostaea sp.]